MPGWVSVERDIRNHWIWQNAEYLKWWLDLIMEANRKPGNILHNGQIYVVNTGEFHTSEIKLAKRWYVDRKTVRKFIKLLENDKMITVVSSRLRGTTIKVNNYKAYQRILPTGKDNETDIERHNERDNKMDNDMDINNKEISNKEIKKIKDKERMGENAQPAPAKTSSKRFKKPTIAQIKAYCDERKNNIDPEYFFDYQEARGWILSNGKPMQDWEAAIRTWERRDKGQGSQKGKPAAPYGAGYKKISAAGKSRFQNFEGHKRDFEEIERLEREALQRSLEKRPET